MLYKREITDLIKIQYIILFALTKADRIVTHDQLTSLVLDKCNIKFTDFRIALDNLENLNYIRVFSPDGSETFCQLLPAGKEANGFFYKKIPVYIREPIEDYIAPFFKEDALKKSISHKIYMTDTGDYMVNFKLTDGKVTLMNLDLFAGTEKFAHSMVRRFNEDSQKIYETIVTMICNEELQDNQH